MSRISGAEIGQISRDTEDYFDKVAQVFAPTPTRSGSGGTVRALPANPTRTSPAQIAPMSQQIEAQYADRLGGRQGWIISLRQTERVPLEATVVVDGRSFLVVGNDLGRSYQMRQRVPCMEVT